MCDELAWKKYGGGGCHVRRGLARRLTCEGQGIGKDTASPFQTNRRRRNGFVSPFLYAEVNQASRTTGHMALVAGRHSASRWLVGDVPSSAFFPFAEVNQASEPHRPHGHTSRSHGKTPASPLPTPLRNTSSTSLPHQNVHSNKQSHRPIT